VSQDQFEVEVTAEQYSVKSHFERLAAINVGKHMEKKGQLSYLSWAWAVDQLLRQDPVATWEYHEPVEYAKQTWMVSVSVTAFGITRRMMLPVMDNRNKSISDPDSFAINTAYQRCLVKAIALHGLALYIYAGEDLPLAEEIPFDVQPFLDAIRNANNEETLKAAYLRGNKAAAAAGDASAVAEVLFYKDARKLDLGLV
jgi:hypothetical protein